MARSIGGVLPGRITSTGAEHLARKQPSGPAAYDSFFQVKPIRESFSAEATAQARGFCKKAIELDPTFAPAASDLGGTCFANFMLGLAAEDDAERICGPTRHAALLEGVDVRIHQAPGFAYIAVCTWTNATDQFDHALFSMARHTELKLWCGSGLMMA